MPRTPKSRFVNRVALRKAITGFSANDLKKAITPVYDRQASKMRRVAKRNAPAKSGSLRGSINWTKKINAGARSGKLGTWYVYSRSIQDMMLYHGVLNQSLNSQQATRRSRTINGRKHRLKAGFNYTGKQLTSKGKVAKRQPTGKDGKPWAWGNRKRNRFLTDNQKPVSDLKRMAEDIGTRIRLEIATQFRKNITVGK